MTPRAGTDVSVALVIVHYRTARQVGALLDSIGDAGDVVVVVDNASPEPGIDEAVAAHPRVQLLSLPVNLGYGGGCNRGVEAALAAAGGPVDVVVVANPDLRLTGADLERLAAAAVAEDDVGAVAPQFLDVDGNLIRSAGRAEPRGLATFHLWCGPVAALARRLRPGWHAVLHTPAAHEQAMDCLHVLGALMAIDARAWKECGGFDESFFMYREETDLCRRLRLAGWRVRHEPSVVVVHEGDVSSRGPGQVAPRARAWLIESHHRYVRKHWGRFAELRTRAIGAVSAAVEAVLGPDRRTGRAAARLHVRAGRR